MNLISIFEILRLKTIKRNMEYIIKLNSVMTFRSIIIDINNFQGFERYKYLL